MTDYLMDPSSLVGLGGSSHHQSQSRSRYANDPRMLTRGLSYDIADRAGIMLAAGHHGNSAHSKSMLLSRKPRSWHPSPYGSDEEFLDAEDDILTREAKKQRIKAEIARRRQQIEQNSRLHDELLRLSRLRECGDVSIAHHLHSLHSFTEICMYRYMYLGVGERLSDESRTVRRKWCGRTVRRWE